MSENERESLPFADLTPSLDDVAQMVADLEAEMRAVEWGRIDYLAGVFDILMAQGNSQSAAARFVASAAGKRATWAHLQYRLATAFPEGWRYPTLDLIVYRVALGAPDPLEAIELAASNQWSAKELKSWIDQKLGRESSPRPTWIEIEGVLNWTAADLQITPTKYDRMDLGDGLEGVPVRAKLRPLEE